MTCMWPCSRSVMTRNTVTKRAKPCHMNDLPPEKGSLPIVHMARLFVFLGRISYSSFPKKGPFRLAYMPLLYFALPYFSSSCSKRVPSDRSYGTAFCIFRPYFLCFAQMGWRVGKRRTQAEFSSQLQWMISQVSQDGYNCLHTLDGAVLKWTVEAVARSAKIRAWQTLEGQHSAVCAAADWTRDWL